MTIDQEELQYYVDWVPPSHVEIYHEKNSWYWRFKGDTGYCRGPFCIREEAARSFANWASDQYWASNCHGT